MCCLSNSRNNLYLKQVHPVQKTWSVKDMGNTIAYDVKSCQDKTTIVNCTEVQLKVFKEKYSENRCLYRWQVCDATINL